jgi:uncharacterized membrane protein
MAKKKFDTNPLDPDFPRKAQEAQTSTLPKTGETDKIPPPSVTEEQTRRFDEANFSAYSSPYDGQQVPNVYQTVRLNSDVGNSSSRKVANIGLPENIMTALPYLPFSIGLIAGIIELIFVPRSEAKVRFHAAQGLAAHIGILIITAILSAVSEVANFASIGSKIFTLVMTIMLIVWAFKAWKGKPVHIEAVDDLTNWLDDKINPRG